MDALQPSAGLDAFFQTLRSAPQRALLLDHDAVMALFHADHGRAALDPDLRTLLNAILQDGTWLMIIGGQAIHRLLPLLGLERHPEIWGGRGWERLHPDGRFTIVPLGRLHAQGLAEARIWLEERNVLYAYEDQPASIAVHWRGLPSMAADASRAELVRQWSPLAQRTGLIVRTLDNGIELCAPGREGVAVQTVHAERGAEAVIAYLGDDVTGDAFRAVKPHGLGVLLRTTPHPSAADLWLRTPAELLAFLDRWHQVGRPCGLEEEIILRHSPRL
jgi:trehalose 6-phosphate phosphatase